MTNSKNNDNGLASEVSDAFGSAVQPALGGTFKIKPPSYHHQGVEMPGDSGYTPSQMERLYMEEIEMLDNGPTPEQIDELFHALERSFK
tara:strand:+ start:3032 stop:3298 length:267 start_codon:yes stop_codon:yes gene_type:complete